MKRQRHFRAGSIVLVAFMPAVGSVVGWLSGCATSEETKQKSKGYYQEGMASLEHDQQKAFVSFQKAVQLDPKTKKPDTGSAIFWSTQGKLPTGRGRISSRHQDR